MPGSIHPALSHPADLPLPLRQERCGPDGVNKPSPANSDPSQTHNAALALTLSPPDHEDLFAATSLTHTHAPDAVTATTPTTAVAAPSTTTVLRNDDIDAEPQPTLPAIGTSVALD
jgi:NAD+ kinase